MSAHAGQKRERIAPLGVAPRVRMQIFPLAADRGALQLFCDRWFNQKLPPQIAHFRPRFPVVLCSVLTYDEMSEEDRWTTGIYSQNEIYFLVLMDRYRLANNRFVFMEHAATTPFIFVDNADSASEGRERFGFPKELCEFDDGWEGAGRIPWAADAAAYFNVRMMRPTGVGLEYTTFLNIVRNVRQRDPGFDNAERWRVPVRPGPFARSTLLWWTQSLLRELAARSPAESLADFRRATEELVQFIMDEPVVNCYNLRQVPDATNNLRARYIDLIRYRLRLRRIQNLRFFDERPSASAPFSLIVARQSLLPIVDILGLRVSTRQQGHAASGREEVFDIVDSIAPFYLQGDIVWESGDRICWQKRSGQWFDDEERIKYEHNPSNEKPLVDDLVGGVANILIRQQESEAPHVRDIKILLLPARAERVRRYFAKRLFLPESLNIEVLDEDGLTPIRVAFTRSRRRSIRSARRGFVWSDGQTMSISILVSFDYEGERMPARLLLYEFMDNPVGLLLRRVIYGGPYKPANFDGSEDDWFASTHDIRDHLVLSTPTLRRRPDESRVEEEPWLFVRSVPRPVDGHYERLRNSFENVLTNVDRALVLGYISDPCRPAGVLDTRLTYSEFDWSWSAEPRPADSSRSYWAQLNLEGSSYDLIGDLGIIEGSAPELEDPWANSDSPTRVVTLPVISIQEGAHQSRITRLETLWCDTKRNEMMVEYRRGFDGRVLMPFRR